MTSKRCDECGEAFDDYNWYPVVFDGDDRIREFCSVACRKRFLTTDN